MAVASWGNYLVFPNYIIEDASASREWKTDIVESISYDVANSRWDKGRWQFSLGGGKVLSSEIDTWDAFMDAVRGAGTPFLFRLNSRRFAIEKQPLGGVSNSNTIQLIKQRGTQGKTFTELIKYPCHNYPPMLFAGGQTAQRTEYVQLWDGPTKLVFETDFTVDRETGVITFLSDRRGHAIVASCKFYILVRGFDVAPMQSDGGDSWLFNENAVLTEVR